MKNPQGKYAWVVKIGEKGQFVIPKEARDLIEMGMDTVLTNDYLTVYNAVKDLLPKKH